MTWSQANTWIASLNTADYLGYSDWELPSAINSDGTEPCSGLGCAGSQMGQLYYTSLGNTLAGGLTNSGPFANLQPSYYWSSTDYGPDTSHAWVFNFDDGAQGTDNKDDTLYAWAVAQAAVPEPSTILLIGSGLIGYFAFRRQLAKVGS